MVRARGGTRPVGLGIGMRFALIMSAVSAALVLLFAFIVADKARSALEESFERSGLDAVRALAAPGADAWVTTGEDGKRRAVSGAHKRLESFLATAPGRFYNAFISGDGEKAFAAVYDSSFATSEERGVGKARVIRGTYRSNNFVRDAWLFRTPLETSVGTSVGFANLVVSADRIDEDISGIRNFVLLMGVLILVVMVVVAFLLGGQIAAPLRVLVQAVSRVNRGNLSYRSTIRSRDELGLLSRALEDMVDNIAAGEEAHEKVQQHEDELQMVTELEKALLPTELPTSEGFEVAAVHAPGTRGVADFYDAVPLAGGRIALIVASSSGKGSLGAQAATLARSLLHAYLDAGVEAKDALFRTNRQLSRGMRQGLHVTAQLVVLDPGKSRATVFVAGHRAPFYSCRAGEVQVVHGEGLALGLDKGPVFERRLEEVQVEMPPGTRLVMTTVGTYEFTTSEGKNFGIDGFQALVRKHAPKNTEAFLSLVLGQLEGRQDEEQRRELDAILVTAKRMA